MNMFKEDNMTVFVEQWGRQTDNSILRLKYQYDFIKACYTCCYTLSRHNRGIVWKLSFTLRPHPTLYIYKPLSKSTRALRASGQE